RNKLEMNDVLTRSKDIAQSLNQIEYVISAKSIMCYVSFGKEVDTHTLIKKWICEGKQVSVPCVVNATGKDKYMHAVKVADYDELTACGKYGILEPPLLQCNIVDPNRFDVIIVPGSAFDKNKNRMGYGAGFYDRFLSKVSGKCNKIGICFDFQVFEKIPFDEHDVPLDLLVTEKKIIL
ncbi:MAG: 5-formyltetrahydrofolate cyclo-ligase, partial [Ruminiclostridium sp.]